MHSQSHVEKGSHKQGGYQWAVRPVHHAAMTDGDNHYQTQRLFWKCLTLSHFFFPPLFPSQIVLTHLLLKGEKKKNKLAKIKPDSCLCKVFLLGLGHNALEPTDEEPGGICSVH